MGQHALKAGVISALAIIFAADAAVASETTIYSYDALGRLVTTTVTGGPTDGLATSTQFDPAGNRTNYQVAGAKPQLRRVVVLPLNGFTVIPLP